MAVRPLHQWMELDESSRSRSSRNGGGNERNHVDDGSHEDIDDALNTETFISSLPASNQPVLEQLSMFLEEQGLSILCFEKRATTQQLMRDYEERGASSWHFDLDVIGYFAHLSSLISSTRISGSTSSRWTGHPPSRRTLPERSRFWSSFLNR